MVARSIFTRVLAPLLALGGITLSLWLIPSPASGSLTTAVAARRHIDAELVGDAVAALGERVVQRAVLDDEIVRPAQP
ncbi:hypothetical protein GCM10011529_20630 [Polymorphobacter glacialis]|uniref:Uncharacterized protein n=1 Tax=Sandarakinorhabdus glacialis TaxID=1614636 RepID=A0A916ZU68_9SPHN|nr:hypothetical protein [Polymorphobacter glacialis]GGE14080.1 hypothetical protein GCM10011529_20630 [Polymorphobacter glacialis]